MIAAYPGAYPFALCRTRNQNGQNSARDKEACLEDEHTAESALAPKLVEI
jgi:hypothetical protein